MRYHLCGEIVRACRRTDTSSQLKRCYIVNPRKLVTLTLLSKPARVEANDTFG